MVSADGSLAIPTAAAGVLNYRFCVFPDAVEYFDFAQDPYELVNRAPTMDATLKAALHARLDAVHACHGAAECVPLLTNPIV